MVIKFQKLSSITGKLIGFINLILKATPLHLSLSRTDIIVYYLSTLLLNSLKIELITYSKDSTIIRDPRYLTLTTINNKSFLSAIITMIGPRTYEITMRKRLVTFSSIFKSGKWIWFSCISRY